MSIYYVSSFLLPFMLALLMIPIIQGIALRIGFVDIPSARKIHSNPIPLGGGIAVSLGFFLVVSAMALIMPFGTMRPAIGMIAGAVLIILIGLYDDAYEMGAMPKLAGQVIAALIFLSFSHDAPPRLSYPIYLAIGIFWIVGIQNALNFLDNMDGLCAGVAMSIAIGLGILFIFKDMSIYAVICFALAGGALGFLRYNLPPASIFLGDTGSLLFGYLLACLALVHIDSSRGMAGALSPFIIMAYPIFDMTFVTISRLNEGRRVYIGGKDHSSHKINFMGLTRKATVFIILAINMILVGFGVVAYRISDSPYQILFIVVLATILAFTGAHLYKNILFLKQRIQLILADFVAVNLAVLSYVSIRYFLGLTDTITPFALSDLAWINIFWIILYAAGGSNELQPESRLRDHLASLARTIIVGAIIFTAINFQPGQGFQVSLDSLLLFLALQMTFCGLMRTWHCTLTHRLLSSGRPAIDAVVVRPTACNDNSGLKHLPGSYRLIGYAGAPGDRDLCYLGNLDSLPNILRESHISRVVLDLPKEYFGNLMPIFNAAFFMDTRFLTGSPSFSCLRGLAKSRTRLEGLYFISPTRRRIYFRMIKRTFDFAVSALILASSSPWIILKALYASLKNITLADKITIVGLDEKQGILRLNGASGKFRFPWGLILVFRGYLSLVGPTISRRVDNDCIPGHWRKFTAKPGLFGPGYEVVEDRKRFEIDLKYIENPSFWSELWILTRQLANRSRMKGSGIKDA